MSDLDPQTTLANDHHRHHAEKRVLAAAETSTPSVRTPYIYHSTRQPFLPVYQTSRIANPSPLAFMALAVGLYLLSMVALGTDGLATLNVVTTVGLGFSGIALLFAGIFEFPSSNPFGAALYCTLSGFFISLSILLSPWSDVSSSYTSTSEFQSAVAQFFYAFFITVFLFIVAAHRSSGGLIFALCLIDLALLFIGLYYSYPDNIKLLRAGGGFGIIAACVSWYAALSSLLTKESSLIRLPVLGDFTKSQRRVVNAA